MVTHSDERLANRTLQKRVLCVNVVRPEVGKAQLEAQPPQLRKLRCGLIFYFETLRKLRCEIKSLKLVAL